LYVGATSGYFPRLTNGRAGHAQAVHMSRPSGRFDEFQHKETEMPKLKTKSGAKKRFRMTATGKVKHGGVMKRHRLIRRSSKRKLHARGTFVLSESDTPRVKLWMPYNR
jgi:large subunit ribosomal protein L35